MAYNKLIRSGNNLELFIYENEPSPRIGRQNTRVKGNNADKFTSVEFPDYRDNPQFKEQQATKRRDNAQRSRNAFRRLVSANLRDNENPIFCSFTFNEEFKQLRDTARFFNIFTTRMRRVFGTEFRYIAVPEFQKSGRVHYHALFWGLPFYIASRERQDRTIAKIWHKGFVDIIETDGSPKLASYMAKYMTKAVLDPKLWCQKAYFASKNVFRPQVSKGVPEWWLNDEYGLDVKEPTHTAEFSTAWLGQCQYKVYDI